MYSVGKLKMPNSTTAIVVVLALCLAVAQASAIGRKGVESKDSVEVTNNGITVKTGYEAYLHRESKSAVAESRKDDWLPASKLDLFKAVLMYQASFLPAIGLKIAKVMLHFVIALFVGIGATTAVCSLSSLCDITFNANKTSFLPDKKDLPALKEALEIVSRIPNLFKQQQTPAPLQQEQPSGAENVPEEIPEQELDARNPRKNSDDESRNAKSLEMNADDNGAKKNEI